MDQFCVHFFLPASERGRVRTFSDEVAIDLGSRLANYLGKDNHSLPYVLTFHALEREGSRLPRRNGRDAYPLPLNGANSRSLKVAQRVRSNEDIVTFMGNARAHDTRDYSSYVRDGEAVVNMELEGRVGVVAAVVGEDVEERANQVEVFAGDVRDGEDGADALGDELRGGVNALLAVADEGRYLPRVWALHDLLDLRYGLLQDVGRANVDFGDDDHDRDVQSQSNAQMLFAHTNETIVGCHHEKTVIWRAGKEAKDSGTKILLMTSQVSESDDLGRTLADLLP